MSNGYDKFRMELKYIVNIYVYIYIVNIYAHCTSLGIKSFDAIHVYILFIYIYIQHEGKNIIFCWTKILIAMLSLYFTKKNYFTKSDFKCLKS